MKTKENDVLKETTYRQQIIAEQTKDPNILDALSESENSMIRLSVVNNPAVKIETLKKREMDKDLIVRLTALDKLKEKQNNKN